MSGGREWTTTEERLLREYYRRIGAGACAEMLERSLHAVYRRAVDIGVAHKDRREAQRFNIRSSA